MLVTLRSYRVKLPNLKSRKPIMISNRTVSRLAIREMINMTFPFSHVFLLFLFILFCFLVFYRNYVALSKQKTD